MQTAKTELGRILESKKITLQRASELTDIPFGTMIKLSYNTNDFKEIKVDTLIKLCIGLNIKAIDLFTNESDKVKIKRLSRKSRKAIK